MNRRLKIAIDFDQTYTEDQDLWDSFIAAAWARSHFVCIVSARQADDYPIVSKFVHGTEDVPRESCLTHRVPIYMTSMEAKRTYMQKMGKDVDIWIDDMPETIDNGR